MSHLAAAHAQHSQTTTAIGQPRSRYPAGKRHRAAIIAGTQAPAAITRESAQVIFCHQPCPLTRIFGDRRGTTAERPRKSGHLL